MRSQVWIDWNGKPGVTSSMRAATILSASNAYCASAFTQFDVSDAFDQSTTTTFAPVSSRPITSEKRSPATSEVSHHVDQPASTSFADAASAHARSSRL